MTAMRSNKAMLGLAAAREYSMLKVRLGDGGTFHEHYPVSILSRSKIGFGR
jgi:hypothetical protein